MLRNVPTIEDFFKRVDIGKEKLSKYNGKIMVFFTPLIKIEEDGVKRLKEKHFYQDRDKGVVAFSISTVKIKNGGYEVIKVETEIMNFPYKEIRFREMYPETARNRSFKSGLIMTQKVLSATKEHNHDFLALVDTHIDMDNNSYQALLDGGLVLLKSGINGYATNMQVFT